MISSFQYIINQIIYNIHKQKTRQ